MTPLIIGILLYTNALRAQPLSTSTALMQAAQARAEALCERNQWSHDGWLLSFKHIPYHYAGENLAKGFIDASTTLPAPADVVAAWYQSPTHRANLLKSAYTKIGIGEACGITVALYTDE